MKIDVKTCSFLLLFLFAIYLAWNNFHYKKQIKTLSNNVEFYIDSLNRYTKIYSSEDFSQLKKENKELYSQLRDKESLVEAIKFEYKYKYEGKEHSIDNSIQSDSCYRFQENTDTISYNLEIWATHIQKYKINFSLTNEFLITRQSIDNQNKIEINSQLPGRIQDVTVWTKPTKKKRFGAGISIGAGYGLIVKKPDIFIGITGTYLIW
jgi:hypothetical protein